MSLPVTDFDRDEWRKVKHVIYAALMNVSTTVEIKTKGADPSASISVDAHVIAKFIDLKKE